MRRDAIYPSIVVGKPPAEDEWLAKATERIFLPAIRMSVPELVDYDLPTAGAFHNCVIVSIRKRYPGTPEGDARGVGPRPPLAREGRGRRRRGIDVHDYEDVFFRVCANVDPKRDVVLADGPIDQLDHASGAPVVRRQDRLRRDGEGARRGRAEWPPEIEMSAEVKQRVDARWAELGLPAPSDGGTVQNGRGEPRRAGPVGSALTRCRAEGLNREPKHGADE